MYKDFLKAALRSASEEHQTYSLSKLIFMSWVSQKLKNDDQNEFEEELVELIKNLSTNASEEDEEINDLLFLFGYKMREDLRLSRIGFENRLAQHYGLEFYYLELIEILSREIGTLFSKSSTTKSANSLTEFLLHQHIRACSIYSEIIHLIKGGFGTGALTRFRSLHELAVISEFVVKHGEEAAECYFDYLPVMQMKDLLYQERLMEESLDNEVDKKELSRQLAELHLKRGAEFANPRDLNDYIWAKKFLELGKKASFNQIRKSINRNKGLKPYKIASNNIHSAPKSIISSLGTYDGTFGSGASNIGISLAGTWGTYEIMQMNSLIFQYIVREKSIELPDQLQSMFIIKMMNNLTKLLYESFPDKENELLEDEIEA